MSKKWKWMICLAVLFGLIAFPLLTATPVAGGDRLTAAIEKAEKGTGKGQINPDAEKGYLGIPGGPKLNPIIGLLWAIWVGWIFSTVGAFGGIMAGVGHMTIYGLGSYAKTFKSTAPALNKFITDSIRVSNQWLVGLAALVSSINYQRQKRMVPALGFFLGIGALLATLLVVFTTAGKIKFSQYQGYFGLAVWVIGAFMIYELTPKGSASKKEAKAAAKAFEEAIKGKQDIIAQGVKTTSWGIVKTEFSFFGQKFHFSPIWAFVGGFVISCVAAFLGIGGGFLYVPFMTSIVGLPMFTVAGTSALAVLIGMIFAIFNFMMLGGVQVHWSLIGMELIGIFIGAMIGPRTGKYIPDKVLKIIFIILALYIGVRYVGRGFFGIALL